MHSKLLSEIGLSGIGVLMNCFTTMAIAAVAVSACSPEPLTTDQLYGSTRDAGPVVDTSVPKVPSDTVLPDTSVLIDVMAPADVMAQVTGTISGNVTDRCSGDPINALVGIANKHWCSFQGKGGFSFTGVPADINQALVAGAPGYKGFSQPVVVLTTGITFDIKLIRLGATTEEGCDAPKPPAPVCICDKPGCGL